MRIGIPAEIKTDEARVADTSPGVRKLTAAGHEAIIQAGAGVGSAITDEDYVAHGAPIASTGGVLDDAQLIVKVKEPQPVEIATLRRDRVLLGFLHLAPDPELARGLIESGPTCVAYETVGDAADKLPLLAPMSAAAGRMAAHAGAFMPQRPFGGGLLIGGVPGVRSARVVVIGGGVVGAHAATIAMGMRADVTVFDRSAARLRGCIRSPAVECELRYILTIANLGLAEGMRRDRGLRAGLNVAYGQITYRAVAEGLGLAWHRVDEAVTTEAAEVRWSRERLY